jgi:hypothetical protein
MKIADSVWLSLYMWDNEKVKLSSRALAPAWAILNFQLNLKMLELIILKDLKNITTLNTLE